MPELPEVETVRQILRSEVIGKTIQEIEIYKSEDETKKWASLVKEISEAEFINTLIGKVIYKIDRKGKWLFFIIVKKNLLIFYLTQSIVGNRRC